MTEIHDMTGLEQADAVRRREVSPVELARYYLDRIDRLNSSVGAFVTVTPERALRRAAELERNGPGNAASPLWGVPTAIKDLNLTAGVPTQFGNAAFKDFDLGVDDYVVEHIQAAGLVSLGKTNVPEVGLPCYTEPEIAPPARTPHDLERSAGGSSGGAAAATASGLVPLAQGNDGAGSVRIPASVCGLVGVKTTRGRVSNGPVFSDINGLAVNGPLARTVADAAALLDVMAGSHDGDPYTLPPLPVGETFLAAAAKRPAKLAIGRYATPVVPGATVEPECMEAYERATALLADLGHTVEDCDPPFGEDLVPQFEVIWSSAAASLPIPPEAEEGLRPLTRWLRERGRTYSAADFATALSAAQIASRQAIMASAKYDAVLTPTLAQTPRPVGWFRNDDDPAAEFELQKRFTPFTAPYNITGQPAVTLPLHWTPTGLPVGVHLVGRMGDEATLLALGAEIEEAAPWRDHKPSIW